MATGRVRCFVMHQSMHFFTTYQAKGDHFQCFSSNGYYRFNKSSNNCSASITRSPRSRISARHVSRRFEQVDPWLLLLDWTGCLEVFRTFRKTSRAFAVMVQLLYGKVMARAVTFKAAFLSVTTSGTSPSRMSTSFLRSPRHWSEIFENIETVREGIAWGSCFYLHLPLPALFTNNSWSSLRLCEHLPRLIVLLDLQVSLTIVSLNLWCILGVLSSASSTLRPA
jgi:hypothetical protein